ncbi:MAG TPA: DUF5777 family beta-barrel protein [Candidatus Polarisedimenticolia bacterium]|nr:DUF5777 family beta-barrel protein [Candidatus Polarisedimenticolia bacterium]
MPRKTSLLPPLLLSLALPAGEPRAQDQPPVVVEESAAFAAAGRLLHAHCAMAGCHAGPKAAQGMRLEAEQIYRSTVNVRARTDARRLRVVPGAPDRSLLYLKLLPQAEGHYRGPRMPLSMDPLTEAQIALVRQWIEAFPADLWGHPPAAEVVTAAPRTFQDSTLANLPTPDSLGAGTLEFRILHRFKPSAPDAGGQGLYGLDGGAWISFGLAYGLGDSLEVGLRRTNLQRDYEAFAKGTLLRQAASRSPLSLALRGSVSSARDDTGGIANRTRWAGQAIVARRLGERVSLMLVPTYVTRTNFQDATDRRGTGVVGLGAEWRLSPRHAVTAEWVVQTSGVKAAYQGGAVGYSIGTARHVFHLLLTNTPGTHTDLYAPGGDLDPGAGDFRLGFNISRTYATRH